MLAFSMIGNNFTQSSKTADYIQDHALEYLANFSRKSDRVSARSPDPGMVTVFRLEEPSVGRPVRTRDY